MGRLRTAWRIWLLGLLVVGGAAALFTWLAAEVLEGEPLIWDVPILLAIHRYSAPWLDTFMLFITYVGLPGGILVTAIGALWLRRVHRPVAAVALIVSFGGSWLLSTWLKLIFTRARPDLFSPLLTTSGYSFPSGHALTAVGLYGFAAVYLWWQRQRVWSSLAVLFGLLIALSRVYLGVHYPSDILGALTVGVCWLWVVCLGYRYYGYTR